MTIPAAARLIDPPVKGDNAVMVVYLVPSGRNRHELYSETVEDLTQSPGREVGRVSRWLHALSVKWHAMVEQARHRRGGGRFAQWRDRAICRLAENIAEQRTLWGLRNGTAETLQYPAQLQSDVAPRILNDLLSHARRYHKRWLFIDLALMIAAVPFVVVPGPNVIGLYFLFRVIGHLQSWRGARRALEGIRWTYVPNAGLGELVALVDVPRAARASRVEAIAARLNLPRLSAFFDRVAIPSPQV